LHCTAASSGITLGHKGDSLVVRRYVGALIEVVEDLCIVWQVLERITRWAFSERANTGRGTDQQGAVVGGALIKLSGVETGTVHNAVSNSDGIYTFPSLPIGAYTLQATVPGFQMYVQTGIVLFMPT
jgi:Carboxypeptidase regulatory-like domain